jgi:hypothetical protein
LLCLTVTWPLTVHCQGSIWRVQPNVSPFHRLTFPDCRVLTIIKVVTIWAQMPLVPGQGAVTMSCQHKAVTVTITPHSYSDAMGYPCLNLTAILSLVHSSYRKLQEY